MNGRRIGFHPCVGRKASGEERPTTVVIRTSDGKHKVYEFGEQRLLDFFTCGAVVAWRDATLDDLEIPRPLHHCHWAETDPVYTPSDPAQIGKALEQLFRWPCNRSGETIGCQRLRVPAELVALQPATDVVGVANGGLGYQIMDVLLGRYPGMDMRVIGSGTLKEHRPEFDQLLPPALRKKAEKARAEASRVNHEGLVSTPFADALKDAGVATTKSTESVEPDDDADGEGEGEGLSKSAAKDANAKFDAHRIAYALADEVAVRFFHKCTTRDHDWAAVNVAYGQLEIARKARVAAEQQFRQIHRMELRRLVKNPLVPYVTLGAGDEDDQRIDALLASYETTLRICVTNDRDVAKKMAVLRQAYARIEGARVVEEEMEKHLEHELDALPEYTEFLPSVKEMEDAATGLSFGRFLGPRIFGRLVAGFGSPMTSRINEPMRQSDIDRIAACKQALTEALARLNRAGLPEQPPSGGGKTREWLLACERILGPLIGIGSADEMYIDEQRYQVVACRDAYRKLTNAKKCAANRPLNRAIAYMGLHVRQGGKYAGTPKDREFPRRRKGGRANWEERLLRQASFQWVTLMIKGKDSYWKAHTYLPMKERMIAKGEKKGAAHKDAIWRTGTVSMRWLLNQWFAWERRHTRVEDRPVGKAA